MLNYNPHMAALCYTAALHFGAGDKRFQCWIYCRRAECHACLEDVAKCEQDVEAGKKLSLEILLVSSYLLIVIKKSKLFSLHV